MHKNKIQKLKKQPNGKSLKKFEQLATEFKTAMAANNFPRARQCCEGVLAILTGNPSVLGDYALTLMRTHEYQRSYEIYRAMFAQKEKVHFAGNWIDGLAEVCGWLGKHDELQYYGSYSLKAADQTYREGPVYPFPSVQPPAFDPLQKSKNIISFSLYGASPRYCEALIKNAELSSEIYPDWTCRVYHDSSVPVEVLEQLRRLGVQLVDMSNEKTIPATLWRFLVIDDNQVTRYLVRDADSLFSEKEAAAVQQWLSSPYWFHHMRDYFTHTELLLAGMWGGCNGIFPSVQKLIEAFVASYTGTARFTDQYFLRAALWPTVRNSILNHDEIFLFHHAKNYPPHSSVRWQHANFHIGSNATYSAIAGELTIPDQSRSTALIELESDDFVRRYTVNIHDKKWQLSLPFFMIDQYKEGKLKVKFVTES